MVFYKSAEMNLSSIAVAYYLLLSLFPLLMIMANILPFLHLNTSEILDLLKDNLPKQLYETLASIVRAVLSQPSTGLLSVSVLAGFWTFSKAMTSLQMAMNKAYEVSNHRDFLVSQFFSILASFAIIVFLFIAVMLSTFGQTVLAKIYQRVKFNASLYTTLHNMTIPAVAITVFAALALLYFIMPNVKIRKLKYVMPGTIFSTFVLVFLSNILGKYIGRTTETMQDFKIVGSVVIFALMLWFIFIAKVLIYGAILNAVYLKKAHGSIETRRGEIVEIIKNVNRQK
ncbi:YihY/virulence factor BrkB family protein [Lactococcus hodotermopsidis]|nr:YihY/virulence factor BrkB family protein [Lactococcus hodotermopsidis]